MEKLIVSNLSAEAGGKEILNDLSLTLEKGDCLALLGPNGHGKSTLLNVLMGSPEYRITSGSAELDGEDLLSLTADQRSRKGIFMAFQNPPDIPGIVASDFFRASLNVRREEPVSAYDFYRLTEDAYKKVGLNSDMASRHLNEGFSGGEKKRDEILQMLLLKPDLVFLDEIDSGLDVDALAQIAAIINDMRAQGTTFVIISHYDRLYDIVSPQPHRHHGQRLRGPRRGLVPGQEGVQGGILVPAVRVRHRPVQEEVRRRPESTQHHVPRGGLIRTERWWTRTRPTYRAGGYPRTPG